MSRGTWEGSGTWKTGGGGPDLEWVATAVVAAVLVAGAAAWLAARVWWILGIASVVLALAAVGAVFAWRAMRRMRRADLAQLAAGSRALRAATVTPQVSQGTVPAVEQHVHYHYPVAEAREAARVITGEIQQ